MNELGRLATLHGTDKGPHSHNYTKWYHQYFNSSRDKTLNLLELGWGGHEDPDKGGESAKMWREYFPNANIVIVDNEKKNWENKETGIHLWEGSQADPTLIDQLVEEYGSFDIIIDDASHLSSLTIESFKLLYPHLNAGGFYVVEDTHMAYHDHWYGKEEANQNPREPTSSGAPTAMQFLETLADEVNFKNRWENDLDLFPEEFAQGYALDWIHFYFNICFMRKRNDT